MFFDKSVPNLIVDPEGVVFFRCPVVDQNALIRQWVDENNIEGIWYDGIFYFKNKEDRNVVKLFV